MALEGAGRHRWKKRAKHAVNRLMGQFDKVRPASKDSMAQIMLDTFRMELGDAEFDRIRDIARDRFRVAFPDQPSHAHAPAPDAPRAKEAGQ